MPKNPDIRKVLVLGSGSIVIRQAARFDYAGTQARHSLKEEEIEIVFLNSNPTTIMIDEDITNRIYIESPTVGVAEQLILKEKSDSVLPTLDEQASLNLAVELEDIGFLKEHSVRLVGTTALTTEKAEDQEMLKETMKKVDEPAAPSDIVGDVKHGLEITEKIGYPVVSRPAYTLDGSDGGTAGNPEQCAEILEDGLRLSRVGQVLAERCIVGWKETEYGVIHDGVGNVITACNMENIGPVGVHTGNSIVMASSQTPGNKEYQIFRTSALNIISELGTTGGYNVQYILDPDSFRYYVTEVNPHVSRSSALVGKAAGYPIAKVAAKIALGCILDRIRNAAAKKTYTSSEPMLDYCVVKVPKFPSNKSTSAKRTLGTQMEATGGVMNICTNFGGTLTKAIRFLEQHVDCLPPYDFIDLSYETLTEKLYRVDDMRIWRTAETLRRGSTYEQIHDITKIDFWLIDRLAILVEMEDILKTVDSGKRKLTAGLLTEVKRIECPDNIITVLMGISREEVRKLRHDSDIRAVYKMANTRTAEFVAETPYYYSCFGGFNEAEQTSGRKKMPILGSGLIRIGQGIEFDFCSVYSTWAFDRKGYEAITVNNSPETVSMDFDTVDKLYSEPFTLEGMESIVNIEKPNGVVMQFGGQVAIKLTETLMKMGVPILGTAAEDVGAAEDKERFDAVLEQRSIPRLARHTVSTAEKTKGTANKLDHPVLMRSPHVLGGQEMQIAISDGDVDEFIGIINQTAQEHPILVGKYIMDKEIGVDTVCNGTDILIPGIMQHTEHTGIYSGDSIPIYPAQDITQHNIDTIADCTEESARAFHVKDMVNIQFIVDGGDVYIIEMNLRFSHMVPCISKVTKIPTVSLATRTICGYIIRELSYKPGLQPAAGYIAIKMPALSFEKIRGADISLGSEMKSIGECLDITKMLNEALYKVFEGAGIRLPRYKKVIMSVRHNDQEEAMDIAHRFVAVGYQVFATKGTARTPNENGVKAYEIHKLEQESPNILDLVLGHQIDLIIDIPARGAKRSHDGFIIRCNTIGTGVSVLIPLDMANALATSLENRARELTLIDIATVKNA